MCFACLVETLPRYCQPAGSDVRWSQGIGSVVSRVRVWIYLFRYDETRACAAGYVSQVHASGKVGCKRRKCAVPMAKLDVMARPRPMYLRCPPWSAQGVQERSHEVCWAIVRVEDPWVSGASRTFPPSSYCNERNSSRTLLVSVQSRLGVW